jgi:ClpP class serine protease
MPNWNQVLQEVVTEQTNGKTIDHVRHKYLRKLFEYTNRNVIAYYSGWLQKPEIDGIQINDDDKNGFMTAIHNLDCDKGLDLILHTPGGGIAATESIIDYLHRKFINYDIRVIVPQLAMSAGTMIACSAREIIMGKQSSLGPIDPQLRGIPAYGVIHEFKKAHKEIKKDPSALSVWQFILNKYHPTFLSECENAINLAKELVEVTLKKVMFNNEKQNAIKAKNIVKYLTNYHDRKTHSRHLNIDECKKIGLRISTLEDDQIFQELTLTIHHCYMHTMANTPAFKIIENHLGSAFTRLSMIGAVRLQNGKAA